MDKEQEGLRHRKPQQQDKNTVTVIEKRTTVNTRRRGLSPYARICGKIIATFLAIVTASLLFYFIFAVQKLFVPPCPSSYGRVCNGRGDCIRGVCVCDILFSGTGCTENQIPGYDIETNEECSGKGFVSPFFLIPPICNSSWASPACTQYVSDIRTLISQNEGNPSFVPLASTIPLCLCLVGNGGYDCSGTPCPIDENGLICSGHGNSSVSLTTNGTSDGNGCQCTSLFTFYSPSNTPYFTEDQISYLEQHYYLLYNSLYCGHIAQVINSTTGLAIPGIVILYSTQNVDYKCYCSLIWKGEICNDGQCPLGGVDGQQICSHKGNKGYGQGLELNSTYKIGANGLKCTINCISSTTYLPCNTGTNPLTNNNNNGNEGCYSINDLYGSNFCLSKPRCSVEKPIRCGDGSCVPFPGTKSAYPTQACSLGYQYGSIDYYQLGEAIFRYKCPNITNYVHLTECFYNTTLLSYVLGYEQPTGGVYVQTNATITINPESQLHYFSFVSSSSGVTVTTWDGQQKYFLNNGTISGLFSYTDTTQWYPAISQIIYITSYSLKPSNLFKLYPMPWNYSSSIPYNSSFFRIRLTNGDTQQQNIFDAISSNIINETINTLTESDIEPLKQNGVLISSGVSIDGILWYYPTTGQQVPNINCLSIPSLCAWYTDGVIIRNLQSTLYVCNSTGTLSVQGSVCPYTLTQIFVYLKGFLYKWVTVLIASSETVVKSSETFYDIYELAEPERTSWPFTITFNTLDQNGTTLLENFVFLTQDRGITYPCVCNLADPFSVNQTLLNEEWWLDTTGRAVSVATLDIDEYLLLGVYTGGERYLIRGVVVSYNVIAQTVTIRCLGEPYGPYNSGMLVTGYITDARTISQYEATEGLDNCDLYKTPFRCPDGRCSSAIAEQIDIPVYCNCTFTPVLESFNCNCTDFYNSSFGCVSNSSSWETFCGFPSNAEFEQDISYIGQQVIGSSCGCLIYTPSPYDILNSSVIQSDINNLETWFEFNYTQIPTHLVVRLQECVNNATFDIYFFSDFFSYLIQDVGYNLNVEDCVYWITLYMPSSPAYTNLTLISNTTMKWAVLEFSIEGFSLGQLAPSPIYSASSNTEDAANVNLQNLTYWRPDPYSNETQRDVWLEVYFPLGPTYITSTKIVFYSGGSQLGNFSIPTRVYLQGITSNSDNIVYETLGSFGVFINGTGWLEFDIVLPSDIKSYHGYRLFARRDFGVRQWYLFTNQICSCIDPYLGVNPIMQIESTTLLATIYDELDTLQYYFDHINQSIGVCVSTDNCTLYNRNVSFNGVCNDVIYQASLLNIPREPFVNYTNLVTNITDLSPTGTNYTSVLIYDPDETFPYYILQFTNNTSIYLTRDEAILFYQDGSNFPPNTNFTLYVAYLESSYPFYVLPVSATGYNLFYDLPNLPLYFNYSFTVDKWADLVESGEACEAGTDSHDCGPSVRTIPLLSGFYCTPPQELYNLYGKVLNKTLNVTRGYFISNLTSLYYTNETLWNITFYNISLTRTTTPVLLQNCEYQVCSEDPLLTYRCPSGKCVAREEDCDNRYTCPGNGCILLTDVSVYNEYRCFCERGNAGNACQYGPAIPATPFLSLAQGGTPGAEQITCGGPPPLRIKGIVDRDNKFEFSNEEVIAMNNRITGGCAPKSTLDVGYHCVMPSDTPFEPVISRIVTLTLLSELLTPQQRTIYTTCPCARKGPNGEFIMQPQDVLYENIYTGEKTYKTYTLPDGSRIVYNWNTPLGVCTYDEMPYRCPGGQCVSLPSDCATAIIEHPICNNQGQCRADGTCQCYSNYKTFAITEEFSNFIETPYNPLGPTWELNYNWLLYPQLQCTARNCQSGTCPIPMGCFTGTKSINFIDRLVPCPLSSGKSGVCAPTINQCFSGEYLSPLLVCSGNGILQYKMFSGEPYCACGDPISALINVTQVSQITQLKPNGYGGVACEEYYYNYASHVLIYTTRDIHTGDYIRSLITGLILPGVWMRGITILGPRPEDSTIWAKCCVGYDRLEECPYVPCSVPPSISCLTPQQCLAISPSAPLVYPCNGHGTPLADGTCECEQDQTIGEGYTADYDEFYYNGCYKYIECPKSPITGKACNYIDPCKEPSEYRYPFPYVPYLEQQRATCVADGKYPLNNLTYMQLISTSNDQYITQLEDQLSLIATQVLEAEASLQACICVTPNDTTTSKCCMVNNNKPPQYGLSFIFPYFLPVKVRGYPTLTNGILQAQPYYTNSGQLVNLTQGMIIYVDVQIAPLASTYNLTIDAIRLFGYGNATLSFYSGSVSSINKICPSSTFITPLGYPYLGYYLGSVSGQSLYCGSVYSCVNMHSVNGYTAACGIKISSDQCYSFKEQACNSLGGIFLTNPTDINYYEGCAATSSLDPDGCLCCLASYTATPTKNQTLIIVIDNGYVLTSQIYIYGHYSSALYVPDGLYEILGGYIPSILNTRCQDVRLFRNYLSGEGTLYTTTFNATPSYYYLISQQDAPKTQTLVSLQEARNICNNTGGVLAYGTLSTTKDYLQRECSQQGRGAKCWVSAVNPYINDTYINPTGELFYPSCATYGCYQPLREGARPGFLFYSNRSSLYQSPRFPVHTSVASFVRTNNALINRFGQSLWYYGYYSSLPGTLGPRPLYISFSGKGCITYIYIDYRPLIVIQSSVPTYLYGEPVNLRKVYYTCAEFRGSVFDLGYDQANIYYANRIPVTGREDWATYNASVYGAVLYTNPYDPNAEFKNIPVPGAKTPVDWQFMATTAVPGGNILINRVRFYPSEFKDYRPTHLIFLPNDARYSPSNKDNGNLRLWYGSIDIFTQELNTGLMGNNLTLGYLDNPYMPITLTTRLAAQVGVYDLGQDPPNGGYNPIASTYTTKPYYLTLELAGNFQNYLDYQNYRDHIIEWPSATMPICTTCAVSLDKNTSYLWEPYSYPLDGSLSWYNYFNATAPSILLAPSIKRGVYDINHAVPLSDYVLNVDNVLNLAIYVHQIGYIQSKQLLPYPVYYEWYVPSCLTITADGYEPTICNGTTRNFICAFDWIKYSIESGYQCDQCGPSTRVGGAPQPNLTCYDDNPLASAVLYPYPHQVKDAYLGGTLDSFAQAFYPNSSNVDFGEQGISVIMGSSLAWSRWASSFSTRPGQVSTGNVANPLSWCDLSITGLWPITCPSQTDPKTNIRYRFCTTQSLYCNIEAPLPGGAEMRSSSLPTILQPVSSLLSITSPICGPHIPIQSYARSDKWGAPQSELYSKQQILSLTEDYVRLQATTTTLEWFNYGKAPAQYQFQWSIKASIFVQYMLYPCLLCVSPKIQVFIYPISPYYTTPGSILSIYDIPLIIGQTVQGFIVNFTINSTVTGSVTTPGGQIYPNITFQGVGFRLTGLTVGSSFLLYNPLITDNNTRFICETQKQPTWYEPDVRINSTVPENICILSSDLHILYPMTQIGECNCGFPLAGAACSIPAVWQEACAGVGDPLSLTYNGQVTDIYGSYIQKQGYIECKTIDEARFITTLLVPYSILQYPFIVIQSLPAIGVSIYLPVKQNGIVYNYTNATLTCLSNGLYLPYYFYTDELEQLYDTVSSDVLFPIFIDVNTTASTTTTWPYVTSGYFIFNNTPILISSDRGLCIISLACYISNINNWAYTSGIFTPFSFPFAIDGDTITQGSLSSVTTLTWDISSSVNVQIYIYNTTSFTSLSSLSCIGGICTSFFYFYSGTGVSYICRCPSHAITFSTVPVIFSEIQIFNLNDQTRSTTYIYYT